LKTYIKSKHETPEMQALKYIHAHKTNTKSKTNNMYHGHTFRSLKCMTVVHIVGFGHAYLGVKGALITAQFDEVYSLQLFFGGCGGRP
jgi:hypothetical protein